MIYGGDGGTTINFPEPHYQNGVHKNERTLRRFKRAVRCLKALRDELVAAGLVADKEVPSFLIECLVYRVDDSLFWMDGLRAPRLRLILYSLYGLLSDQHWVATAREINNTKLLFGVEQPWSVDSARRFVSLAINYLEA